MDFERDWNVDAAADRQQAPDPGLAALAARVKAAPVQPGTLHTVTPNADGMVVLPAGTDIDKIDVDGRNLVVTLPDGTQMVILDGAVVVPRIVVGDVEIPSVNLAALLIGEEPQPAAGPPRSSGGNFLADDGAIGDPFGLGDLLPPTELQFSQPEEREILPIGPDDEPDVTIITPNQPAGATDATANVSEAGLGARNGGEPAGSAFGSNSHVTTGTIAVSAADGPALVTINGIAVTGADQAPIDTPLGMLIITGVSEDEISYRYVLKDNVVGIPPAEIFTVVVTDADGDQATATLTISIADDSPRAVNDVDSVTEDGPLTADGNVFSGSGGTDANATDGVADVPGADGVVRVTTGVFQGTYGELTLSGLGDYRYVLNNSNPAVQFLTPGQTLTETFTYSITDADNSPSNATLTITINGADDGVRITGLTGEPGAAGAELTLFENDLTDGSSPDASALVQGGTFSISAADGLTTVTVDGVAVLTDGVFMGPKVVTTALGTLTIDTFTPTAQQGAVPTAGTFTYHFTLTDNSLAHSAAGADDIVQSFTVVATDRNGSDDTASLDVRIVDDQPVAVDDVDLVPAGSYGPQAGNVITGEGTIPEGAGKDVKGADDAHVAGVVAGVSEQALDNAETLGKEVHGLYGKLILAADGHYDYMRDPGTPGNVSDTFTYTLRDGDGDLSIATLRIDIANSDVSIAPTIGEGTVVDESGLIEGKSPAPGSNAGTGIDMTQGVITYSAPDGPATITINDIVIVKGTVIQTDKGELVIGNITGTSIEYSYSLTSNIDNSSQDPVTDDFKVTVTDVDGDSKTEILSITILDDRPMAVADVDSVKEDGPLVADGNVLTGGHGADANSTDGVADVQGADGAKVTGIAFGGVDHPVGVEGFVEIGGTYGTLHISAHGDYVYTLNNENGLVQGLDSTQTLTESFTYTITDNDPDHADRSQATLTITIAGNNDGVTIDGLNGEGAEEIVYEASLPGGSAQNSGALTQPGSFTLTALDGVKTVTIGGQTIFADDAFTGTTIKNAYGTLSIDDFVRTTGADGDVIGGTIKYHYVLDDNTLLHTGANDGSLTDSFAVVVLDTDESRAEASLDITVVDDRPFAIDDVVGQEVENTPVEFNVISGVGTLSANVDTLGADGVNLAINGDISWTDPAHGTLTYLGDGRFHYEQVPGAAGEDSFTYTITDGDKDSSTATVTILLAGDSTPTVTVGDLVVSEAGLPNGTQAAGDGEIASGTMAITTGGDTLKMVEVEGKDGWVDVTGATDAVPVKVDGLAGTLRVTSAMGLDGVRHYSYSYTLTTNDPTHPDFNPSDGDGISGGADEKAGDSFAVRVTDSDDDVSLPDSIDVTVQDDAPLLSVFGPETVAEGGTVTGSWSQTIGADQPGAIQVVVNGSTYDLDSPINTGKGTLTVNSDFTWTFVAAHNLNNSVAQSVSFTVRVTDADNDVAQDSQTIGITDGANPSVTRNAAVIVDEEALGTLNATGTNPSSTAEASSDTVTFLAGADNITGIAFTTIAGITADVNGNGVADIAWTLDSATQITGRIGGILAITLTLTPPTLPILAGASGSAGVAVTISDNFPHVFGGTSDIVITGVKVTATDSDSDAIDATAQVTVIDDAPIVVTSSNIALAANNLSATGDFKFVVGADSRTSFSAGNSDLNVAMSGLIGSTPTTNHQVVWASEDAHSAVFKIAFDYDPDPTNASNPLVHETGTLGFDKDLGQYTLTLDQEIVGFSTVMTSQTLSKQSYNLVGQSESQPEVVVSKLADQFFVRFTGGEEASGPSTTFTDSGGNGAFAHGETFVGSQAWVSISGGANGVSSDTLQAGEVLNMDFYTASPNGNLNPGPGTATATGMYLKLDGLTGNEDLVVILKLVDPDGSNSPTTRAIVVDAGDIYKSSESNPYGITFADGSDGVVIIEGNDYNFGTENYVIVGAQLLTSTETVTGSNIAIDLNRVTGATGASTSNTKSFGGTTVDNDVIKITDIGVVTTLTTTQILKLDIDVTVTDSDGDSTAVTTLTVNGGVPPVAFDLDGDGLEFVGLSAGVAHDYGSGLVNTAWVSSDDGLLAHAIGGGHDIVFSDDAAGAGSDLEGLRLAYDSNGDGLFDAKDAAFAEFGVWQDLNANGQVDAGEFKSLAEAGIAAIELTSNNQSYAAAGGDVTVLGEASFVRTDGSKGTLGDVLFATSLKEGDAKPAEGSGFTQALVAAGLVAVAGAAEAVEQAPAPVVAAESEVTMDGVPAGPVATAPEPVASDAPATSLAASADQDAHVSDQPVAPSSHGAEDVAPEHAGLSEGGDAPTAAVAVEAPPADPGDHGALLAQAIDLPPAFDGAAAVLAAHGAAPAAVAQVVAQALGTGSGPDIDALLAALPGGEHAPMPMLTPMLAPMLADAGPAVDAGHMAAAVFDAAMVAHEAMAVAHG